MIGDAFHFIPGQSIEVTMTGLLTKLIVSNDNLSNCNKLCSVIDVFVGLDWGIYL